MSRRRVDVQWSSELEQVLPAHAPDPLTVLEARFQHRRWVRVLADAVDDADWRIVMELVLSDADMSSVATSLGITVRAVRTARERVAVTAFTVRAALDLVDNAVSVSESAITECVPVQGGLRQVLPFLDVPANEAAAALGLAVSTFRNRRGRARRLCAVARHITSENVAVGR